MPSVTHWQLALRKGSCSSSCQGWVSFLCAWCGAQLQHLVFLGKEGLGDLFIYFLQKKKTSNRE